MPEIEKYMRRAVNASEQLSKTHAAFLEQRADGLRSLADLISLQVSQPGTIAHPQPALLDRSQLEEFAAGSIVRCFGPEYAIFEGHRYPRIPNSELLLMDRVVAINGTRHQIKPGASITTEYTVPSGEWFGTRPGQPVPYFTLMEMALQPCGLLSAYLGTAFLFPGEDYYFRNLDGQATLLEQPIIHGQVVTGQANLISSITSASTIIQKFRFSLSVLGRVFYQGESIFGYFPAASLASQAGIDQGQEVAPTAGWSPASTPLASQPNPALPLLERITISPSGGKTGSGSLWAEKQINPQDWFFSCHFYQDPVMPGSLGVEAMIQGFQRLLESTGRIPPHAQGSFSTGKPIEWKYRGQILRTHQRMLVEVNLERIDTIENRLVAAATASLWSDRTRIYEVKNLSLEFPLR